MNLFGLDPVLFKPYPHHDVGQAAFKHRNLLAFQVGCLLDIRMNDDHVRPMRQIGKVYQFEPHLLGRRNRAEFYGAEYNIQLICCQQTEQLNRIFNYRVFKFQVGQVVRFGNIMESITRPTEMADPDCVLGVCDVNGKE